MVDIYVGQENTHWVLHEKLLCHRSRFFRNIFYDKERHNKRFGLPDEDDAPFRLFVGWLYSGAVPSPREENDLAPLFDLYLMAEKWEIRGLVVDVLDAVRHFYHANETYPGLRRVQYIYANTDNESPMRQLMVSCIARFLVLGDGIPQHWDKALRKNGQLAVDIILSVQKWKIDVERVPDAREDSVIPIVDDAEHARGVKKEEEEQNNKSEPEQKKEEDGEEKKEEGEQSNGAGEEHDSNLPNGVSASGDDE